MNRSDRRAGISHAKRMERRGEWGAWEDVAIPEGAREAYGVPGLWRAYRNAVYSVQVYPRSTEWGEVLHLMVRRHDGTAVRVWHDLQRIKSTLPVVGPERVAVEVFPREGELVDDANLYHLWVLPEALTLPFGPRRDATWGPWWRAQRKAVVAVGLASGAIDSALAEAWLAFGERTAAAFEERPA